MSDNQLANQTNIEEYLEESILQHKLLHGESILLVMMNGFFMPEFSEMHKLPEEILVCSMQTALDAHEELIKTCWHKQVDTKKYPLTSLNIATPAGLFICLPDHFALTMPIHLLSLHLDEDTIAQPQHIFMLGQQSRLHIVEEYFSLSEQSYKLNVVANILLGKQAELTHDKIQQEGRHATHAAYYFVMQKQESKTKFHHFATGGETSVDHLIVKLQEQGASCETAGLYFLQHDQQQVDYHIDIDHVAIHTESKMLYKGVLKNKSRANFTGRVHVAKQAQKTLAYQANHNLLLSPTAEVYSKPILEIYADDVKCKHGATVGQLDQAALFYLRSRGIEESIATNMLLEGFAQEVLQEITHPGIKQRAEMMVQTC